MANVKDEALKMAMYELEIVGLKDGDTYNACKEALEQPAWQGLTDEELNELADFWDLSDINIEPFIEKVERKVKEKNHG
jgi:hypothetical protein